MTLKLTVLNKKQPKQGLPSNAPTVEEVYASFQKYQNAVLQIINSSPESWQELMHNRREVLKAELTNMGLADRIKWD